MLSKSQGKSRKDACASPVRNNQEHERASERSLGRVHSPKDAEARGAEALEAEVQDQLRS